MNEFLDSRWLERVQRLALGLEPTDPVRRSRIGHPVEVATDGVPHPVAPRLRPPGPLGATPDVLERIGRRDTGRHVLVFREGVADPVDLRLLDATRRYVPRRLRFRLPDPASRGRICRPALFPGAAYDVPAGAVGLRGRVTRDGAPLRWARAVAMRIPDRLVVGRAHGDDRGEFLLLLGPGAVRGVELTLPIRVRIQVYGPDTAPDPDAISGSDVDPLWDLPREEVALAGADGVLNGRDLPPGYVTRPGTRRVVEFGLDGLQSREFEFS